MLSWCMRCESFGPVVYRDRGNLQFELLCQFCDGADFADAIDALPEPEGGADEAD